MDLGAGGGRTASPTRNRAKQAASFLLSHRDVYRLLQARARTHFKKLDLKAEDVLERTRDRVLAGIAGAVSECPRRLRQQLAQSIPVRCRAWDDTGQLESCAGFVASVDLFVREILLSQ